MNQNRRSQIADPKSRYHILHDTTTPVPELHADDLTTIAEAAEALGISVQSIAQAMDAGRWTVSVDTEAPQRQGRRLLLKEEVEARLKLNRKVGQ